MTERICGIDPGKSGGIAILDIGGDIIMTMKMPETDEDLAQLFRRMVSCVRPMAVYCERVHTMPGQGISSTGKFMQGYGVIRGILAALSFEREYVTPQKWQKHMGCLTHGDKNISKDAAQRLWPHYKITHAIADAMLIAEYGRRHVAVRFGSNPIDLL